MKPNFAPGDALYWFDYSLMSIRGATVLSLTISSRGDIEYAMSDGGRLDGYTCVYTSAEMAINSRGTLSLNQH